MSLESDLRTALLTVTANVHPDVTPDNPTFPLIVYQQVGGQAVEYLEAKIADKNHARMQVLVWSKTRAEANSLAHQARVALVEGSLRATTYAAPVSVYDDTLKLYGCRTDYGIWHAP